jgi:hypothetical protein
MEMGRYLVDAVLLEKRRAREVATAHGVSKSWIYWTSPAFEDT